jgi:hypothetical protein
MSKKCQGMAEVPSGSPCRERVKIIGGFSLCGTSASHHARNLHWPPRHIDAHRNLILDRNRQE